MKKYSAILIFIVCFVSSNYAQFNIKIGYDGAYAPAMITNESIQEYNQTYSNILNEAVPEFHWLHGLNMGVRYKRNYLSSELSWESLANTISSIEINGNNATEKKLYYRLNNLAYNQELIFGIIGIGVSAEYGFYRISSDLSGTSEKRILAETNPFSSKLFLSINLKGSDILSFSIKPYYRIQWNNELDMNDVNDYFDIDANNSLENMSHFGIHISFYNGPQ